MSVILDALKKLEQEKQNRAPGPIKVRPENLIRGIESPRKKRGVLFVVVLLVAHIAAGATYFLVKKDKRSVAEPQQAALPFEVRSEPVSQAVPDRVAPESRPQSPEPAAPAPVDARVEKSAAIAAPPAAARSKREKRPAAAVGQASAQPRSYSAAPAPITQETPADLTVSGIAWQDNRADRRAVINGGLYREGASLGDATIVLIQQDRVRFSRDGRTFDVPMATPFPAR